MSAVATLARYPKTERPSLDKQILRVRALLEHADREYYAAAAADIRRFGETAHEMTHYPTWVWERLTEALVDCAQAGWDLAIKRAKRRIDGKTAQIFAVDDKVLFALDDVTRNVLKVATEIVMPREAIAQYVAERIPPLEYTVERTRRLLCRDIVVGTADTESQQAREE